MIKCLELFGGIGTPRKSLENLKYLVKTIDYVEVWDHAVLAYNNLFNNDYRPQNIKDWNLNVNICFHGSPCQDWSNAGKKNIESGRSLLFLETIRIIEKELQPLPKYIVWENVKGLLNKCRNKFGYCPACNDFVNKKTSKKDYSCYENDINCQNYIDDIFSNEGKKKACHWYFFNYYLWKLEQLGYNNYWQVLNSKDFGIPQTRNRVFVVSIRKDLKQDFNWDNLEKTPYKKLKYFLDKEVDKSYYITAKSMVKAIENGKIKIIDNIAETVTTKQCRWNNAGVVKMPLHAKDFNSTDFVHNSEDSLIHTIGRNSANNRIAVPILETEAVSHPNYNILPRNTDGELIGGRYNRYWKTDKLVGTIPASDKTRICIPIDYKKTRDGKIQIDFNGYDQESRVYLSDDENSLTDSLTTNPQSAKVAAPILEVNKDYDYRMSDGSKRPIGKINKEGNITVPLTNNHTANKIGVNVIPTITTSPATSKVMIPIKDNQEEVISEINLNEEEIPQVAELILDKPIDGVPIFIIDGKPYHLRVLTERECWRLMGWKDKDINKVTKLISKTHLYFLAGNAIVIQVLEAIFKELLKDWEK